MSAVVRFVVLLSVRRLLSHAVTAGRRARCTAVPRPVTANPSLGFCHLIFETREEEKGLAQTCCASLGPAMRRTQSVTNRKMEGQPVEA